MKSNQSWDVESTGLCEARIEVFQPSCYEPNINNLSLEQKKKQCSSIRRHVKKTAECQRKL